jgi:fumarylacetoacetase
MIDLKNPNLKSWITVAQNNDFPIQNLPFGIFTNENKSPRVCSRIGDFVVDIAALGKFGFFNEIDFDESTLSKKVLNDFIALGKLVTNAVRERVGELLNKDCEELRDSPSTVETCIIPIEEAKMLLPVRIGDYTDFYASREHATNVGIMFRDPANALLPNWLHLPVGYHGRSSSVIVSGTPIHRPKGQTIPKGATQPVYGACKLLDFELEMAFIVGKPNDLGKPININDADEHIFGMVLFNDWSARDIQKWEYVPLGPFLGKSFASSISPWIITTEALEAFRCESPTQEPQPLPYLKSDKSENSYDINISMGIKPENSTEKIVTNSNFKYMYWTMVQQLTHHTVNGCNMQVGDMCGSGTISGSTPDSYGSMLEIAWQGTKPVDMPDGSQRKFINDGDTVTMRGHCEKNGLRIGFGDVNTKVLPAID